MPRFTVKRLLSATTLVAVGVGMIACMFQNEEAIIRMFGAGAGLLPWFGGGALVGAGLLLPFRRPLAGAIVVIVLQWVLVLLLTFTRRIQ